jgi:hypothetical protein
MNSNSSKMIFLGTDVDINLIEKIEEEIVVVFELEKEKDLIENGIKTVYFHRQAQSKDTWDEISKNSQEWWSSWYKKPIDKKKSMVELLEFNDTSLWWFVKNMLWEDKNGIFDTIYQIETLIVLVEKFAPKFIVLYGKFEFPINDMLNALMKKYDFKISDYSKNETIFQKRKIITKKRMKFLLKLIILKVAHRFSKEKNGKIAIFSFNGGVIKKDQNDKKIAADQYFIGLEDFIERDREKINFISLDKNLTSKNSNEFLKLLKKIIRGQFEPWVVYYSLEGFRIGFREQKKIKKKIREIENSSEFINSMNFKGINLYPFLRQQFIVSLPFLVGFTYLELEAVKRFLSKHNPDTIFTIEGFGPAASALNYVCHKKKKRVITPQLGIIGVEDSVNAYFLIEKEFDLRLLPEYFSWGKYFAELIESKKYPQKLIKQIGFWRTEQENEIKKIGDYIFFIAGSNRFKLEYMTSLDEEIFTIRRIHEILPKGIKLVVKLHPSHSEEPYVKALSTLENIVLITNKEVVDINPLINHSKIVIGKVSTLIIHSMIQNKPIIVINFAGEVNFLGIKEIPFVTNINEFSKVMNGILQGKISNQYTVNDYCYPVGEKAVSNLINELMNN